MIGVFFFGSAPSLERVLPPIFSGELSFLGNYLNDSRSQAWLSDILCLNNYIFIYFIVNLISLFYLFHRFFNQKPSIHNILPTIWQFLVYLTAVRQTVKKMTGNAKSF